MTTPSETRDERNQCQSASNTIPSPLLDCTAMPNIVSQKYAEGNNKSSVPQNIAQHPPSSIQTNDTFSNQEIPNSVHIEAAPHSPKLCYTGYTLSQ
ncbi:unnamed protein product [Schistosoma turkestanicum]|nr:unnamed protein product [Schistosoma turkestanicum]